MDWLLADTKNRFSELVSKAPSKEPQRVRRQGETVIVVDEKEYQCLKGTRHTFKDFLLNGPDMRSLDLVRDKSPMPDADL